jgi:muconolactone delta-isomerase
VVEFLVNIELEVPEDEADVDDLKRREAVRAAELAKAGTLLRLWRVPGRWANWGLWSAPTEADLHAALDLLPLRPYMQLTVHELQVHPSDPGPCGGAASSA